MKGEGQAARLFMNMGERSGLCVLSVKFAMGVENVALCKINL